MDAASTRRLWFHGLCTVGWAFVCLQGVAAEDAPRLAGDRARVVGSLLAWLALFGAPPLVLLRALLQRRVRVGWRWRLATAGTGLLAVLAAGWLWLLPGHVRLENTRLLAGPVAFAVAWACTGVLAAVVLSAGWVTRHSAGLYVSIAAAIVAGLYGLLPVALPGTATVAEDWTFLMAPLIVLETAACYGVLWAGARRANSDPVGPPHPAE